MHVSSRNRRTPESKFTKFGEEMSIGQTPNCAKFCGDPTKSVRDICGPKFVLREKVDQNSSKLLKTCYLLKPPIVPNFVEINENTLCKSITEFFTPFSILAPQGDPLGRRSPVWLVRYTNPPLATCKKLYLSDDLCPIYLLPNFVDFVAGMTHRKNTVNYMCPHCMQRQKQPLN